MKKKKQGRKFGRESSQRKALLRSLARELFLQEKITTTEAKAKEMRMLAEKMITQAKKNDLASKRNLLKSQSPQVVKKLMTDIALRYKLKPGGYTRIIKLGPRASDASPMAIIELVK